MPIPGTERGIDRARNCGGQRFPLVFCAPDNRAQIKIGRDADTQHPVRCHTLELDPQVVSFPVENELAGFDCSDTVSKVACTLRTTEQIPGPYREFELGGVTGACCNGFGARQGFCPGRLACHLYSSRLCGFGIDCHLSGYHTGQRWAALGARDCLQPHTTELFDG